MISVETLKSLFADRPGKAKIIFKGRCSDCGCDVTIDITPASAGFGFLGGSLFEHVPDWYSAKCPDCYKSNPNICDDYDPKYKCTIVKQDDLKRK